MTQASNNCPAAPVIPYIFLKDCHRKVRISLSDIVLIEAADNYVYVHLYKRGKRLFKTTLINLEDKLRQTELVRVNNSFIVNTSHVEYIELDLIRIGDREVALSKKYAATFWAKLLVI